MKCIDFDKRFAAYLEDWTSNNQSLFANMNELEAQVPDAHAQPLPAG